MRTAPPTNLPASVDASWCIGIVASSYYKEEVDALVAGAIDVLQKAGILPEHISLHHAPGSFEIPLIGATLAASKKVDALIALGIIVEGETQHARLLADSVARGIMDVQLTHGTPFAFEILYVSSLHQAQERSRGSDNRGCEAARAVLHSLTELKRIRDGRH